MNTDMNKPDPNEARRYLFDVSFDNEITKDGKPKKPEPTFSKIEIEEARKAAYQEGFAAGRAESQKENNNKIEALLKNIDSKISQATQDSTEFWGTQIGQMQNIALMIAKKIMPSYAEKHGLNEVEVVVQKVMAEMSQEPRLVFRIAEDQFDEAKKRIDTIAAQAAYAGKLVILGDKNLSTSECRVEWADGGIERDLRQLWDNIDTVMGEVQTLSKKDPIKETEEQTIETPSYTSDSIKTEPPQTFKANMAPAFNKTQDASINKPEQQTSTPDNLSGDEA